MSEAFDLNETALNDPWSVPLEELDPSQPIVFQTNAQFPIFERLRAEDPIHFHESGLFGPYWSITKFNDIAIDKDHARFSSESGLPSRNGNLFHDANFIRIHQSTMFRGKLSLASSRQ